MKRVGIASFLQESNSFAPRPTVIGDFQTAGGTALLDQFEGTNSEVGGFLEASVTSGGKRSR